MEYPRVVLISKIREKEEGIQLYSDQLHKVTREEEINGSAGKINDLSFRIAVRSDGELAGKGFYLSKEYDWVIVKDSKESLVLVPIKNEV